MATLDLEGDPHAHVEPGALPVEGRGDAEDAPLLQAADPRGDRRFGQVHLVGERSVRGSAICHQQLDETAIDVVELRHRTTARPPRCRDQVPGGDAIVGWGAGRSMWCPLAGHYDGRPGSGSSPARVRLVDVAMFSGRS